MIIDKQCLFSEDQDITVTANSTNIIDLGNDNAAVQALNEKGVLEVFVQVTTAFTDGTAAMKVSLFSSDSSTFNTETTISETASLTTASLGTAGYQFRLSTLPPINQQYLRLTYTVTGTFTAGAVLAGLLLDRQTNV